MKRTERALLEGMMRKLATDQAGLEMLHLGDMFRLLATVPIGRIGFMADDEVAVLPVLFRVDGQDVVFKTQLGSKLANIEVGHYVCFEVDYFDAATHTGWSVVARGLAEKESDAACARLDAPGVETWGGATAKDCVWMRIRPTSITGRRIASPETED
jgi:nitroimidazol reductase NimA-like FMN-containing flavoprotein (pyridoxamine 5'-phosphate oxidase superfamily)